MKTLKLILLSGLALGLPMVTQTAAATHRDADVLRLDLPVLSRNYDRLPVRRMLRERHGINPDRYNLRAVIVHSSHTSYGRVNLVVDGYRSQDFKLHGRDYVRIPAPSRGNDQWQLHYTPGSNLHRVTAVLEPKYDRRTYVQNWRVDQWVDHWFRSFDQPESHRYHGSDRHRRHDQRHGLHTRAGHGHRHGRPHELRHHRHHAAAAQHARKQAHAKAYAEAKKHAHQHTRQAHQAHNQMRWENHREARREHRREDAQQGWRVAHGKLDKRPEKVQERHLRIAKQNHDNKQSGPGRRDGTHRQRDL